MELVVSLRDAASPAAGTGGKAAGLAHLVAAGLPVPDGFVLSHAAFTRVAGELPAFDADPAHALAAVAARAETAPIPDELAAAVAERVRALGAPLVVRSSVSIEDTTAGSGAGVLASATGVDPDDVWAAIRAVWASACTPLVVRYARGGGADQIAVGVIVQREAAGERVTVYTRPPGAPTGDAVWIERAGATTRVPRDVADPIAALALVAERAIGAETTGADVELVATRDGALAIVQARPIVHPRPAPKRVAPPAVLLASLDPAFRWRWDVEHNPDPLSPAQAGLVAQVDAARIAPYRMCTVAGYLFVGTVPGPELPLVTLADATTVRARYAELEAEMAASLGDSHRTLELADAIARYLAFYATWARAVSPLIASARAPLAARGAAAVRDAARTFAVPTAIGAALAAAARGELSRAALLDRIGDCALAWDVAAPTLREQPALLDAALAAAARAPASPPPAPPTDPVIALALASLELGELDDLWFARAQAMVRRALRARGVALGLRDPDDAFWLPLDEVAAGTPLDPITAAARAGAARTVAERARCWDMAAAASKRQPDPASAEPRGNADGVARNEWTGDGGGGRAVGRVRRLDGPTLVSPGTIVVARTITPTLALLVGGAAALVAETGGILAHGAALARELGIPFVVGCAGAWHDLVDGDRVIVDGGDGLRGGIVRRIEDVATR